jgi:cellulose biosynthesis protein BcsQ
MKSIVVFNNKGGVGKTTLLCNLASFLSIKRGKRVLIIDADPQCNSSTYLVDIEESVERIIDDSLPTIQRIFKPIQEGDGYLSKDKLPITKSSGFNVDLIYGDSRFSMMEDFLSGDWMNCVNGQPRSLKTTLVIRNLLYNLEDRYDYVFFDVGPSLGAINRVVLLGSDYFIIPMSSDIFSLQAIKNISLSLNKWINDIRKGLDEYKKINNKVFTVNDRPYNPSLSFLGYVNQQYISKSVGGIARPVKAFEKIINQIPNEISHELSNFYSSSTDNLKLGDIPNYNSLIPLSQLANKPIFELGGSDGVVGAHFAKVKEFEGVIGKIANNLINNIDYIDELAR